jgi:hypothetical protein
MAGAWPVGAGAGPGPSAIEQMDEILGPSVPVVSPKRVYIFNGHGGEILRDVEKRDVLPPGVTLVVFSECGHSTQMNNAFETMIRNANNTSALRDPVTNKNWIESTTGMKIKVYPPNTPYPNLEYYPVADYILENYPFQILCPSGLQEAPMSSNRHPEWVPDPSRLSGLQHERLGMAIYGNSMYRQYCKVLPTIDEFTYEDLLYSFQNSVFPVIPFGPETATTRSDMEGPYPVKKIFETVGPGVYYWGVCRDSSQPSRMKDIDTGRIRSARLLQKSIRAKELRFGGKRRRTLRTRRLRKNHSRKNVHRF